MNRQITELTNLVLTLTEKISSSNREGNNLNTVSIGHETRSDNHLIETPKINHLSSAGHEDILYLSILRQHGTNISEQRLTQQQDAR